MFNLVSIFLSDTQRFASEEACVLCLGVVSCIVWSSAPPHLVMATFFPTKEAKPTAVIFQTSYVGTYLGSKTGHVFLKLHQSN